MRICIYTDTALPKMGGQEIVVDALARQFQALGHPTVVFAPKPRKLSIRGESYSYEMVRHPRFYSTHAFVSWYRWFLLAEYRRRPFDVLHCHGIYPPSYLAALLGARLPVPVVVTSHGGDVFEQNVRLQKPAIVARCVQGLENAGALVAISQFTRQGLSRLCPRAATRIVEIPNGVHVANFAEPMAADAAFSFEPRSYTIFLGRLKHRKGVDVLLRALALIPATGKIELLVVGDGEERPALEQLSAQLGLTGRVRFLGAVRGAGKVHLLQNARFGVVPSRNWEAFPLVVTEGYAAGLPMIGTNIPGLADLIEPEKTGLVVPAESPEPLAAAMQRLFADDELVRTMSRAVRVAVKKYDWRHVAQQHLDLYQRLLGTHRAAAA
jgi:glycosyltransferase involved in cell wall biosynthesis